MRGGRAISLPHPTSPLYPTQPPLTKGRGDHFLEGKTALVTGASRGIGFAIAKALAKAGCVVGICGRNEKTLEASAKELGALTKGAWGKICDVRSESQQEDFFAEARKRFSKLDICVPNAGGAVLAPLTETKLEDWNKDIETNLTGTFLTMRAALRWMKEKGGGVILPVLSQASRVAFETRASYCASKWGSLGLVECARLEARKYNVRITALLPASVATDFQAGNPMGMDWMLSAEDVAEAALYALSVSDRVELPEVLIRCRKKPTTK